METEKFTAPIFAGIVSFHPDMNRLRENITAVAPQADCVVIVDNHSDNVNEILSLIETYDNVRLIRNDQNNGIAKALNQIFQFADQNGAEWVLTLDQDSVVSDGLIETYLKYVNSPAVGMLTCLIKDRNAKGYAPRASDGECMEIERCFTSGCFTRVSAWKEVGGFDEKMFIDYVDYDMCLSIRERGYVIIRVNFDGLLHELGHSADVRFLGRNWVILNHSSFRKYYIVRNRIYYIKKHARSLNVWAEKRHLLGFIALTIFKEPNKFGNMKAMLRGMMDSRKM